MNTESTADQSISANRRCAAATIVSKNYFAYAKTLARSFLQHNSDCEFFILVVDDARDRERFTCDGARVVFLEDLNIPQWRKIAFKFDIMELNTNVKPSFLKFILDAGAGKVLYLDPDIFVYAPLRLIYDELSVHNIVLTPHTLQPISDDRRPVDRDFLKCGVYNLGFIGVADTPEARRFLDWWGQRCLAEGFNEMSMGWFVDQKWIDLVPCYFDHIKVLKHYGCNVAYWNLHERENVDLREGTLRVNGVADLLFFHFSGIDAFGTDSISRHQNRFDLNSRPDLRRLFDEYRKSLLDNEYARFRTERYAFGEFSNGEIMSPFLRRVYASIAELQVDDDPFSAESSCYLFARKHKLLGIERKGVDELGAINSMSLDARDTRLRAAAFMLRLALSVIGVARFQLLGKFMRYFGVPNNQAILLFRREKERP